VVPADSNIFHFHVSKLVFRTILVALWPLCIVLLNELSADDIVACTASDFNDLFPPSMFGSKIYSVYS